MFFIVVVDSRETPLNDKSDSLSDYKLTSGTSIFLLYIFSRQSFEEKRKKIAIISILLVYTLNKKSLKGQGKSMVTVLQKKFIVQ